MNLMRYSYSPAGTDTHETPVSKGPVRRERNAKMATFLRKVNGSTRYSAASLEEQTTKALTKRKA